MNKQWNWKTVLQHEQAIVWTQIVLGCIIGGAAYPLFLTPCNIAPGGLTGVGMILNYLFQFPIGTTALVLNIPLFIMGYRSMCSLSARWWRRCCFPWRLIFCSCSR